MKTLKTFIAINILAFFPLAASAQSFGTLNINLNDVMSGQRMQAMSETLKNANSHSIFEKTHRAKKQKTHKMALLPEADVTSQKTDGTTAVVEPDTEAPPSINTSVAQEQSANERR